MDSSELKAFVQHKTPPKMAAGKRPDPTTCLDGNIIIGKFEKVFFVGTKIFYLFLRDDLELTNFDILKFVLGCEDWGNKTKEITSAMNN